MNTIVLNEYINRDKFKYFSDLLKKTIEVNIEYSNEYSYLYNYIFINAVEPNKYVLECLKMDIPIENVSEFLLFCYIYRMPECVEYSLEQNLVDIRKKEDYECFQLFLLDLVYDTSLEKEEINLYLRSVTCTSMISDDVKGLCNILHLENKLSMFGLELEKKSKELEICINEDKWMITNKDMYRRMEQILDYY
jgi:hypothetical protein